MRKNKRRIIIAILICMLFTKENIIAKEIRYQYDELNRLIKVIYDEDVYIEYIYDKNGNIINIHTEGLGKNIKDENVGIPEDDNGNQDPEDSSVDQTGTQEGKDETGDKMGTQEGNDETEDEVGTQEGNDETGDEMGTQEGNDETEDEVGTQEGNDETEDEIGTQEGNDETGDEMGTQEGTDGIEDEIGTKEGNDEFQEETESFQEFEGAEGIVIQVRFPEGNKYTGKRIEPNVRVLYRDGIQELVLEEEKDYKVQNKNNINVNAKKVIYDSTYQYDKNLPSVIVSGKGAYSGVYRLNYNILPGDFSQDRFQIAYNRYSYGENGKSIVPKLIIKDGNTVLKEKRDYTVAFCIRGETEEKSSIPKEALGEYEIIVRANGNYKGEFRLPITLVSKDYVLISEAKVTIKEQIYNDKEITPSESDIQVKVGKRKLRYGVDYTIKPNKLNNTAGYGSVTICGVPENGYVGEKECKFLIRGANVNKANLEIKKKYEYGSQDLQGIRDIKVFYTVSEDVQLEYFNEKEYLKKDATNYELIEKGDVIVLSDRDYTIEFQDMDQVGKGYIILSGKGIFQGTKKRVKISILPQKLIPENIDITVASAGIYRYGGATTEVEIVEKKTGKTLKIGEDYTVVYKNNKSVNDNATLSIKGIGNYTGTIKDVASFAIAPKDLQDQSISVQVSDVLYKRNQTIKAKAVVYDNGKKIPSKEYSAKILWPENYEHDVYITQNAYVQLDVEIIAQDKNYKGSRREKLWIYTKSIGDAKIDMEAINTLHIYNGKEHKPAVSLYYTIKSQSEAEDFSLHGSGEAYKVGDRVLLREGLDYDLTYTNNLFPGKACIEIHGSHMFGGIVKRYFIIARKKVN